MRSHVLCLGSALTLSLFLLGTGPDAPPVFEPLVPHRVADTSTAPHDTLTVSVPSGTPLVRSLPDEVKGAPVTQYVVLDGPPLSGTAGRSVTWIPREAPPGSYDIRLQATHPDTDPDTLLLRIDVES